MRLLLAERYTCARGLHHARARDCFAAERRWISDSPQSKRCYAPRCGGFSRRSARRRLVRAMLTSASAHSPDLWRQLAELGWLGILVPEEFGGMGGSFLDMAVVLEEAGRALVPGPFFATAVVGTLAVREGGSRALRERLLPEVARGDRLLAPGALHGRSARRCGGHHRLRSGATAMRSIVSGTIPFVMDAHVADTLIVPARPSAAGGDGGSDPAEIILFVLDRRAPGVEVTPLATVDMTRRLCTVALRDVAVSDADVLGGAGAGAQALRRVVDHALAALAVELVGSRAARPRPVGRLCQRADAVRAADRQLPGGQAQVRGHDGRGRDGALARVLRGMGGRARSTPRRRQRGRDGEGVLRGRRRTDGHERGDPGARRHRVHLGARSCISTIGARSRSEAAFGAAPAQRERILAGVAP